MIATLIRTKATKSKVGTAARFAWVMSIAAELVVAIRLAACTTGFWAGTTVTPLTTTSGGTRCQGAAVLSKSERSADGEQRKRKRKKKKN